MGFDALNRAGQAFAEATMGEAFSYTAPAGTATAGTVTSGLTGVFNQVSQDFQFGEFSTKKVTSYTLISGKVQWGSVAPADRGIITDSSGGAYQIDHIAGASSAGEPAYELNLRKLT